jgi:hypothetical protein
MKIILFILTLIFIFMFWYFYPSPPLDKNHYIRKVYPLLSKNINTQRYFNSLDFYWAPALTHLKRSGKVPRKGDYVCLAWEYSCRNKKNGALFKNLYDFHTLNSYRYKNGTPSHHFVEVYHARLYPEPGIFFYVAKGTGIFLNVGKTLVARNKIEALKKLGMSDQEIITANSFFAINSKNHFKTLSYIRRRGEAAKKDLKTTIALALQKAQDGTDYGYNRMANSSSMDYPLYYLGKKQGYDTIQFTIQPNDNGGWAYELLDLRADINLSTKQQWKSFKKYLTQRNPFDLSQSLSCRFSLKDFRVLQCL